MRILWFTNTQSLFQAESTGYNGGGWISSLEENIANNTDIELGVCFFSDVKTFKVIKNKTTYYPVCVYDTKFKRVRHRFLYRNHDPIEVDAFMKVIEDFKPEIIHIFGSEKSFGLISYHTKIPIVIHIQGILIPYLNSYFPPGTNKFDFIRYYGLFKSISYLESYLNFKYNAKREQLIISNCRNFTGRTEWDKNVVSLYSNKPNYFYCSEILRKSFYTAPVWNNKSTAQLEILTTISQNTYKGFDLILKTAKILKMFSSIEFSWKVYGIKSYVFWEKKLNINSKSVNVHQMGVVNEGSLINAMQNASMFVHPSYIDNSPNSVCEAQLVGMPVVATNVGGVSALIENNVNGILVPANDPFTLASKIMELFYNKEMAQSLGKNARETALQRHAIQTIIDDTLNVYKAILN